MEKFQDVRDRKDISGAPGRVLVRPPESGGDTPLIQIRGGKIKLSGFNRGN